MLAVYQPLSLQYFGQSSPDQDTVRQALYQGLRHLRSFKDQASEAWRRRKFGVWKHWCCQSCLYLLSTSLTPNHAKSFLLPTPETSGWGLFLAQRMCFAQASAGQKGSAVSIPRGNSQPVAEWNQGTNTPAATPLKWDQTEAHNPKSQSPSRHVVNGLAVPLLLSFTYYVATGRLTSHKYSEAQFYYL